MNSMDMAGLSISVIDLGDSFCFDFTFIAAVPYDSFVSLRVIISKQFGSSTLLHGFDSLPHMDALPEYVRELSRIIISKIVFIQHVSGTTSQRKRQNDASPGCKQRSRCCSNGIGVRRLGCQYYYYYRFIYTLFMCRCKQWPEVKWKCQIVNDSPSPFRIRVGQLAYICSDCRSDSARAMCVCSMHCIANSNRLRKRGTFFHSFYCFLFVFASDAYRSRPHRVRVPSGSECVCVSAECHLI